MSESRTKPVAMMITGLISMIASLFLLVGTAGAHSVLLSSATSVICAPDGLYVSWTAVTWNQVDPAGRHPNIIVDIRTDITDWTVVQMAPLSDANGRSLSGFSRIPDGASSVTVRATPDPRQFWEGTNVVGAGASVTLSVPEAIEFCGFLPTPTPEPTATPTATPTPNVATATAAPTATPTPTATATPQATATTAPTATPTATATPTVPPTVVPPTSQPTATPTATTPPTSPPVTPTATPSTPTVAAPTASFVCVDEGAEIRLTANPGTQLLIVVDGSLETTVTIDSSGTATIVVPQEPGETNTIDVRTDAGLVASGDFSCVEGTSSPGQPEGTPEPEVLGQQQLAQTGAESVMLTVIALSLLIGGALMTAGGAVLGRRS